MGVTGLWRLIDASGKPVPLETLEGKILAIDISIWIYQVIQGYQDRRGHAVPNAHLLGLYNRICKLLYFKIKPVFVFDGGVPLLKKNTIAARKKHKVQIIGTAEKMKNDLLHNLMKHSLVKGVLAKQIGEKVQSTADGLNSNTTQADDMYKLPELPSSFTEDHDSDGSDTPVEELSPRKQAKWKGNIHNVDVNTNDFKALPADVRYDILTDLKETRKQNSWGRLYEMPDNLQQFSGFQMKRLLKRRQVQESLETAEREMGGKTLTLEELDQIMTDQGVDTKRNDKVFRIASNSMTRMIYINDLKNLKSSQEASDSASIDLNQPSCSSDTKIHGELSSISEESTPLLDNINEYDFDDEWDSDLKVVNEAVGSPTVKKFFGKSSNPVLAYMQAQSGLSQEKILEFIQQNKGILNSKDKSEKQNKSKRKRVIEDNKKIFTHKKKARTDSETSLEAIEEMIKIKEEISSADSVNESDQFEVIEEKSLTPPPKEQKISVMSSDSDSDDFLEVNDVPIPYVIEGEKKIEITVKAGEKLNDDEDIFADVFELEQTEVSSVNSSSDLSIEQQTTEFFRNVKLEVEKLNSSSESSKAIELLKSNSSDNSILEELNSSIEEITDTYIIEPTKTDVSIEKKSMISFEEKDVDLIDKKSPIKLVNEKSLNEEFLCHKKEDKNVPEPVVKTSIDVPVNSENFSNTSNMPENKISSGIIEFVQTNDSIEEKSMANFDNKDAEFIEKSLVKPVNAERSLSEEASNYEKKRVPELAENVSSTDDLITPENSPNTSNTTEKTIFGKKPSERVEQIITKLKNDEAELLAKANREEDLLDMRSQLENEHQELVENIGKLERQATEVTAQMRSEAQDLLRLFGIPYVVAPQEAEAQCAYLELLNLTDGTITDDSDIWLFGGRCVYKNFFNNDKRVMQYLIKDIEHHFKLTRQQMIQLALLVGSDYTLGIPGIGPVTALEVLANFPAEGDDILRGLINFATWLRAGKMATPGRTTLRNKLKNIAVDLGFPSQAVAQAYLFPTVDESTEPFSWSKPNIVLLADYTREKFGWSRLKFDEIMGPVMKKFLDHKSQKSILNYFKVDIVPRPIEQNLSKRVQKAVKMMGKEGSGDEYLENGDKCNEEVEKKGKRKQRKTSTNKQETLEASETEKETSEIDKKEEKLSEKKLNVKVIGKNEEYIPQREKDKAEAQKKKLQAIEVFKKSTKGQKKIRKKPVRRTKNVIKKEANLSESSSDSN